MLPTQSQATKVASSTLTAEITNSDKRTRSKLTLAKGHNSGSGIRCPPSILKSGESLT